MHNSKTQAAVFTIPMP